VNEEDIRFLGGASYAFQDGDEVLLVLRSRRVAVAPQQLVILRFPKPLACIG